MLVRYAVDAGRATITLDSPANRNALSDRLVGELADALAQAQADPSVRVVVLTHTSGTFCAGADLSEASRPDSDDPARDRADRLAGLLRQVVALRTPVVGLVDGHVRAGGMGLVGACDLVVAGPRATFALTEARLGLAPSVVSLVLLPRLADREAARLFLTGEVIDGPAAARIGLVSSATQDAAAATDELVQMLLAASPQGLAQTKALVNHDLLAAFDAGRDRVVTQSSRLFASEEAQEGMAAFLARRPPRWAQ